MSVASNIARTRKPIIRFEEKYIPEPNSGCWLWLAAVDGRHGYAVFDGRWAHRKSYKFYNGSVPDGLFVLHRCDNPLCVNPEHLELGSQTKNMRDASRRERFNRKLTGVDVQNILNSRESGAALAKQYNVSKAMIRKLRNGRAWRHLSEKNRIIDNRR